jgi:hypothetical protein
MRFGIEVFIQHPDFHILYFAYLNRKLTNADWLEVKENSGGFSEELGNYSVFELRTSLTRKAIPAGNDSRELLWSISESQWNIHELTSPVMRVLLSALYLYFERLLCATDISSKFSLFALEALNDQHDKEEVNKYVEYLESLYEVNPGSCLSSDFFVLSSWVVCQSYLMDKVDSDSYNQVLGELSKVLSSADGVLDLTVVENGIDDWLKISKKLLDGGRYHEMLRYFV